MNRANNLKPMYNLSKSAKVGESCFCPSCGSEFIKTNVQQAFCKTRIRTKCKDYYWNNVTPNKRNNTTRISPANARYHAENSTYNSVHDVYNDFHPFEGLNDEDYKNH